MTVPALPPDVWAEIAKAALAAEDYEFGAWSRLSLVARAWRDGLRGMGVNVSVSESVSAQQSEWLSSTTVRINSITFSNEERASEFLTQGGPSLPASLTAIRLESDDNIELEKLRCSDSRLSAAAGLALVVTAGSIDCKQEWMCNRLDRAAEHASKLPAGFTALELHMIDDWTCEGSDSEFKALDSDEVEALTEHMRRSAGRLGMSVNVMKEAEMNCINVIRLWNKLRSSQCEPSAR